MKNNKPRRDPMKMVEHFHYHGCPKCEIRDLGLCGNKRCPVPGSPNFSILEFKEHYELI